MLYLHLAATAAGLGLRADATTLRVAAGIAAAVMVAAMPLRMIETEQWFRDWTYNDRIGQFLFPTYVAVGIVGAVLAGDIWRVVGGMVGGGKSDSGTGV